MRYYLSLGANIGNREQTIHDAIEQIEQQIGSVPRCSSFYYSAPWGFASNNEFCNVCCLLQTDKSPLEVLHLTQAIERALGRAQKSLNGHYTDRTIDIDIIQVFEGTKEICWSDSELTLPHPLWRERDFVTGPLKEIKV